MKKYQIFGITLIAVFAFSVVAAAMASGAIVTLLAEWLVGGTAVTETLSVEASGELLLEDTKVAALGGAKVAVLCSGILDGTIGVNGVDEVKELLSLAGAAISLTALSGTALLCAGQTNCEAASAKVWALNLPWQTLLELVEQTGFTGFADLILSGTGGNPGWYVECTVLGIKAEDDCTVAQGAAEAKNPAEGNVETIFSEAFTELVELKLATCTGATGAETGIVEGIGKEAVVGGGTLTVSSTG